jgi:hypothetical protein
MPALTINFPDEQLRKRHQLGGEWYEYTFANGYGASVVRNAYSYGGPQGKWELAVIKDGDLCYDTDITDDVLGWLEPVDVAAALSKIAAL